MDIKVKYEMVYQGLTFDGMLGHIAKTIILWNLGNDGDPKRLPIGGEFLLRSYHRRMLATGKYGEIPSTQEGGEAFNKGKGTTLSMPFRSHASCGPYSITSRHVICQKR